VQEERRLRRDEVTFIRRGVWAQVVVLAVAVLATGIATYAAVQSARSVEVSSEGSDRQAHESRLAAALSSINSDEYRSRAAGYGLLRRNVERRIRSADTEAERGDAADTYVFAVDLFITYIRVQPASTDIRSTSDSERETSTLAFQLAKLIELYPDVRAAAPDLSFGLELNEIPFGPVSWPGVDLSGLTFASFNGADLRNANLAGSNLTGVSMDHASLECANLAGATLIDAGFVEADLRGADLSGADLRGANLKNVNLEGAIWDDATRGLERFVDLRGTSQAGGPVLCGRGP
jgi:hypothetical protein